MAVRVHRKVGGGGKGGEKGRGMESYVFVDSRLPPEALGLELESSSVRGLDKSTPPRLLVVGEASVVDASLEPEKKIRKYRMGK